MISAFKRTVVFNRPALYEVQLTDQKWYPVNRCTGEYARVGKPLRYRKETKWCI